MLDLSRTVARGQGHRDLNSRWHTVANRCIHIPNLRVLCNVIKKICSVHDFYTTEVRGQGHSCPKVVHCNLKINMHPHTNLRLLPQMIIILIRELCWGYDFSSIEARGQGNSDLKQYVTFQYTNMYPLYWISMSYNIGHNFNGPKLEV